MDTSRFLIRFLRGNYAWMLIAAALLLLSTSTLFLVPMGLMAALGMYRVYRDPRMIYRDLSLRALLFLFLCLWLPQLISLVDAVNLARSAKIVSLYPLYLFCGVFILRELSRPGNLSRVSLAFLLIAVFWCVDGLIQYATGANLLGYPYDTGGLSGMFYPKLRLGFVLAVLVPVVLETLRNISRGNTGRETVFSWLILIPFAAVVLLSGRRSAWIMMIVALSAYLPLVFPALSVKARYVVTGVLCLAVLLVAHVHYRNPDLNRRIAALPGIFSSEYEADRATSRRVPIWETARNMLEDNWINGVGPRGFRYVYETYADEDDIFARPGRTGQEHRGQTHPHLVFLEIAVETGMTGIAGFILFYFIVLRYWWRGRGAAHTGAWTSALLAAAFPLNAHMAFYGSYWSGLLWLLIPCALAATLKQGNSRTCP